MNRHATWFFVIFFGFGCGETASSPGAPGGQISLIYPFQRASPNVVLAAVDDTLEGDELRGVVAEAIEDLGSRLAVNAPLCQPYDPAAWHPVDWSFVIAHPSAGDDARYSSPASDPALRFRVDQPTPELALAWTDAALEALAEPAAADAAFQPLLALHGARSLLSGAREPEDGAEAALLAALPGAPTTAMVLAVASEDRSPGAPEAYRLQGAVSQETVFDTLIVPNETPAPDASCLFSLGPATPRLAEWLALERASGVQFWPCKDPSILEPLVFSCAPNCLRRPIAKQSGTAQCRVFATLNDDEPCPEELGWIDPLDEDGVRRPRLEDDTFRVCEVRQLEGAALEACRTSLECDGCEPGWCATEVEQLLPRDGCPSGTPSPFRFVGGSGQARNARGSITCNTVPLQAP